MEDYPNLKIPYVKIMAKRAFFLVPGLLLLLINAALACETTYPNSPQEVVRSYLEEDSKRGPHYFDRISRYTTWIDGPGWDTTILISGFTIRKARIAGRNAEVEVEYVNTAEYSVDDAGPVVREGKTRERVTFALVSVDGCWKIESPQNPPHLIAKYIIDDLKKQVANPNKKNNAREISVLNKLQRQFPN